MSVGRYVVVDQPSKTIIGGPWGWDGVQPWIPPAPDGNTQDATVLQAQGVLLLEADALAAGYVYPPAPTYVQNYVVVDPSSMLIVAGPAQWDGTGDPPLTAGAGQQFMTESDALAQGYAYPSS